MNRSLPASWRAVPGRLRLFIGIDGRRPASWITLAMGGWLGWWCAVATVDRSGGIAMLSAAVLAVAAIGDIPLPLEFCLPAGRGRQFLPGCVWAGERAAWPFVGMMLGMLAAVGVPTCFEVVPTATAGALLATVTTVASRLSGAKAADAASLVLLVAAASATAAIGLVPRLAGSGVGGVAAWLLLGGLVWAWSRSHRAARETLLPGSLRTGNVAGADVLHVDALPANGPLRQTLTRLAMVAALAAMAGWLVLEPSVDPSAGSRHDHLGEHGRWDRMAQVHHAAAAWALFTAAWFVCLAVPQATLQDGMAGAQRWERLLRTTPGQRLGGAAWWLRLSVPRLGSVRFAGGVAVSQAAILGWPVLVCVVLSLPTPAAARLPLGIVIGLAGAAALVTAIVAFGAVVHASRETTFAAALALPLAIVVGGLAVTAGSILPYQQLPDQQPASPNLPSSLPPPAATLPRRLTGGFVLLQTRSTCESS